MIGDILVMNSTRGGIFSSLQRFFTRMPFTHTAIDSGNFQSRATFFGADMVATVVPQSRVISDPTIAYTIFRPIFGGAVVFDVECIFERYAGNGYGFTQLFYFVWRWFFRLLHIDIRKRRNPFPSGDICSEIVYEYIKRLAVKVRDYQLLDYLAQWNENTIHAGDIYTICSAFPEKFKFLEQRNV